MKFKRNILIILFLVIATSLGAVIYLVPGIASMLTETMTAEYRSFQVIDDIHCYVVRDETVYLAAGQGSINYYLEQNSIVRKGSAILAINSNEPVKAKADRYGQLIDLLGNSGVIQGGYQAEFSGVVSFYIDGYENYFTPQNISDLKYEELVNMEFEPENLVRKTTLFQEPLYKICRNNEWHLVAWVDGGEVSKYQIGRNVTVYLPKGEIKAVVSNILQDGEKWQITLTSNRYYEDFATVRTVEATVLTSDYKGIIVPNESLAVVDGQVGVYVINKKDEKIFTTVKVLATDGEKSCLAVEYYQDDEGNQVNTVDIYDELVRRPN